jgi:hypothetical protein
MIECEKNKMVLTFNRPNPSICTTALGPTQPLAKMSTWNFSGGKGQPMCKDDLTAICENVGALISHNSMGLHGLLQGWLYLLVEYLVYCAVKAKASLCLSN